MNFNITQAIVGVAGCLAVAIACYVTKVGYPLWGLLAVVLLMAETNH